MAAREEVEKIHNRRCRLCYDGTDALLDRCDEDGDAKDMGPV